MTHYAVPGVTCPAHTTFYLKWAKLIIYKVRADQLTSQVPSLSLLSLVESLELKMSKFMTVFFLINIFSKFKILKWKNKLRIEEISVFWGHRKVIFFCKGWLFPYIALSTASILFYFIAFILFSDNISMFSYMALGAMTWSRLPCAKLPNHLFNL